MVLSRALKVSALLCSSNSEMSSPKKRLQTSGAHALPGSGVSAGRETQEQRVVPGLFLSPTWGRPGSRRVDRSLSTLSGWGGTGG